MSRGRGHIQEKIVASLVRLPDWTTRELAAAVWKCRDVDLSANQLRSVHRALQTLARDKTIKISEYSSEKGEQTWTLAGPRHRKPGRRGTPQLKIVS